MNKFYQLTDSDSLLKASAIADLEAQVAAIAERLTKIERFQAHEAAAAEASASFRKAAQ